jgi:general secretion pathway protein D
MRNVALALSLFAFLAAACASGPEPDRESPPAAEPAVETAEADPAGEPVAPEPAAAPRPAQEGQGAPGGLDRDWQDMSLAEQRRAFLVEQHIERAQELKAGLRLQDALRELEQALQLDPDSQSALRLRSEVRALMGQPAGGLQTTTEQLGEEYRLQQQQIFAATKETYDKAKVLLARGEYDAAIAELTLALDQIRWSPYSVDWRGLEQEIRTLLDAARAQREAAAQATREEAQREARQQLRAQEQAEQERRKFIVANLLDQAISAFEARDYDEAIQYADRVLAQEPRNQRALDIRYSAYRAGREKVQADFLERKREQYQRWQEEMEELKIPYTQVVTLPDQEFWTQITELRSRRQGLDLSESVSQGELELQNRLATTRIPGLKISQEESLTAVVDALRVITGLPLVVDPAAEEAAIDEGVVFDLNLTNPITVEKALNLITEMGGENVTWTIRHDAVLVTTPEKARGKLVIYNHDVQDLIFGLTDFLGPRIDRLRLLDELEDEDGGGPFGGIGERPMINEPDDLITLVQENVAVASWQGEGVAISVEAGNMIVVQTPEVQKQIRQFLEDLRRFSASLVTIESKFMTISDNFLQEIGVDFRGLDNPGDPFLDLDDVTNGLEDNASLGLDNSGSGADNAAGSPSSGLFFDDEADGDFKGRTEHFFGNPLGQVLSSIGGLSLQFTFLNDLQVSAILRLVEKSENIELINDQVLSVHNTQRAYVTVINQQAYIQDFDVEVAQFEAIADPQINVLVEGIVLDVRPTINHDRRYLTLEIQPTVARVVSLTNFSTTLAGQTAAVTFQLPELEVQSVFTTAIVPDGGSILLGGLSRIRNVERRSEVPWLANIPLLGFFFKEEGYSDEKNSLMIMIRAWITDVKEELAHLETR